MQARLSRFDERVRKKRELVAAVMEDAGLKKLVEPDFTVSLRPARAPLVVIDEESVPGDFWKSQPAKLWSSRQERKTSANISVSLVMPSRVSRRVSSSASGNSASSRSRR
jgi:hypothetical protein